MSVGVKCVKAWAIERMNMTLHYATASQVSYLSEMSDS